jgi:hypothetical protein
LTGGADAAAYSVNQSTAQQTVQGDAVLATGQNPAGIFFCCVAVGWWNLPKSGSSVSNEFNQVSKSGGAVTTDFTAPGVRSFTFFDGYLYFTQQTSATSAGVVRVNFTDGTTKVLANGSSSVGGIFVNPGLAPSKAYVYFIVDSNIERAPALGETVQTIAHDVSPHPWTLTQISGYVFWYDRSNGMIGKVKASGGTPVTLVPGSTTACPRFAFRNVRNIMWIGTNIYWTDSTYCSSNGVSTGALETVPESGGSVTTLYSVTGSVLGGLSFSFNLPNIYFVQQVPKVAASSNGIYEIPYTGGTALKLAGTSFGSDCTLGATSTTSSGQIVYYIDGGNIDKVHG